MQAYDYINITCPDCGATSNNNCQGSTRCYKVLHPSRMWKSMYLQSQAKLERQRDVITDLIEDSSHA